MGHLAPCRPGRLEDAQNVGRGEQASEPSVVEHERALERGGSRLARLTHFKEGTLVLSAAYSPDGARIVYATKGIDDKADVFLMRADGTGNRPVTRSKLWDSAPDWGPAGS